MMTQYIALDTIIIANDSLLFTTVWLMDSCYLSAT